MLQDVEYDILLNKRKAELECLGIEPSIYFLSTKKLNKDYKFIYKDVRTYLYDSKDNHVQPEKIKSILKVIFSVDELTADRIFAEWVRDRIIYHNMMENQAKYFDWLTLPVPK